MATTLKTLVLKTAMVHGVKLSIPADRIGLGRVVATYPAGVLSAGQFPLPPRSGHRSPNTGAMRMHREEPATREPCGRDVPGSSAHRWPASFAQQCAKPTLPLSRASFLAASCRDDSETASTRETTPTAAAAI